MMLPQELTILKDQVDEMHEGAVSRFTTNTFLRITLYLSYILLIGAFTCGFIALIAPGVLIDTDITLLQLTSEQLIIFQSLSNYLGLALFIAGMLALFFILSLNVIQKQRKHSKKYSEIIERIISDNSTQNN